MSKIHYQAIIVAIVLTAISYVAGLIFGWIKEVNYLEAFSVFTSYWCTYLCVFQSRWNYPVGIVSVTALCVLFYQQSLFASMALQVYLFPTLIVGWFIWGKDEKTRSVQITTFKEWLIFLGVTGFVGAALWQVNVYLQGSNAFWDTIILVYSVLAQFLLDWKKLENWIIWLVVDIISVLVYWNQDLKILSIQMGLFGLNAIWGFWEWDKARVAKNELVESINLYLPTE